MSTSSRANGGHHSDDHAVSTAIRALEENATPSTVDRFRTALRDFDASLGTGLLSAHQCDCCLLCVGTITLVHCCGKTVCETCVWVRRLPGCPLCNNKREDGFAITRAAVTALAGAANEGDAASTVRTMFRTLCDTVTFDNFRRFMIAIRVWQRSLQVAEGEVLIEDVNYTANEEISDDETMPFIPADDTDEDYVPPRTMMLPLPTSTRPLTRSNANRIIGHGCTQSTSNEVAIRLIGPSIKLMKRPRRSQATEMEQNAYLILSTRLRVKRGRDQSAMVDNQRESKRINVLSTLKKGLHDAQQKQNSMSSQEYYFQIYRNYSDRVKVAAAIAYVNADLEAKAFSHRMKDQCSSRIFVYTNDWLMNHSNQLENLPSLVLNEHNEWSVPTPSSSSSSSTDPPTKIWVFFPDSVTKTSADHLSNSARVEAIYNKYYNKQGNKREKSNGLTYADVRCDYGITSIPIELLLQEDEHIHILLVIQRGGDLVSMPGNSQSKYYSSAAHIVHTVPSSSSSSLSPTLGLSGNYCSFTHLCDTLITKLDKNFFKQRYPSTQDYTRLLTAKNGHIRMMTSMLMMEQEAMSDDEKFYRHAEAITLESPEEIMYMLSKHVIKNKGIPTTDFIENLRNIVQNRKYPLQQHALSRLLQLIQDKIQQHSITQSECHSHYGCGHVHDSAVTVAYDNAVVFELTPTEHVRPLFYIRLHNQRSATDFVKSFREQIEDGNDGCYCVMKTNNDTLHVPPFQSHKSVENVMDNWQEMFKNHIYNEPTSLVPLTVKPSAGMNCFYSIDFETDQVLNTVNTFLPRNLIDGALLAQCENKTSGIHLPQFNLALSSGQTQVAITQNIHNQCQRLGFYDYLADTGSQQ